MYSGYCCRYRGISLFVRPSALGKDGSVAASNRITLGCIGMGTQGTFNLLELLEQLSCQHYSYLPTERAIKAGGYSADKFIVGPEGGRILVNETVKRINAMWE